MTSGGASAGETGNSGATIFYTQESILNKRITGTIASGGDDDMIGLVLGFNPGDTTNPAAEYLLIDWKGVTQAFNFSGGIHDSTGETTAPIGLAASLVQGAPTNDELWGHVNDAGNSGGGLTELARALTLGGTAYSAAGSHEFEILYADDQVQVFVDGVLQFNLAGTFGDGRLGLYELGHDPGATFSNFAIGELQPSFFPGIAQIAQVPEPASLLAWLAAAAMAVATGRYRRRHT